MTVQLLNCKKCMQDKHDECTRPDTCLCSVQTSNNAVTLRDVVRLDRINKDSLIHLS